MSAWLLLSQVLRYYCGSLFATTLCSSNIFFWLVTGYLDAAAGCATCRDGSSQ